jgi:hypothetical protein
MLTGYAHQVEILDEGDFAEDLDELDMDDNSDPHAALSRHMGHDAF